MERTVLALPENPTYLERLLQYPADPRVDSWPFMGTPAWPMMTIAIYLYVVLWWGPRYMKTRQAYSLKTYIYFYNFFQVIMNAIIFYAVFSNGWTTTHKVIGCHQPDWSKSPEAMRMASAVWWVFIIKMIELSETVVYILRKKDRQVSFLHTYHHVSTYLIAWTSARFCPGGSITFGFMPNCLIHVIMYSYFLLSAIDNDAIRKTLSTLKKYLTALQLLQLSLIVLHATQGLSPNCAAGPKLLLWSFVPNVLLLIYLFVNFYRTNYKPTKACMDSLSSQYSCQKSE